MRRKLLLADDSPTIQRVIELTFADEDFEVVCVSDGQQAIDRIMSDHPDAVLADVEMPEKSGYEVSTFVKDNPHLAHIPVILLTGAFEPIDEHRADVARADAVLAKPFEPQAVVEQVQALLANQAAALPPAALADESALVDGFATVPASAPAEVSSELAADQVDESPDAAASGGESVDEYLDRLDAAFATLNSSVTSRPPADEAADAEEPGPPPLVASLASEDGAEGLLVRNVEPRPEEPAPFASDDNAAQLGDIPVTPITPDGSNTWDFSDGPAAEPASVESAVPLINVGAEPAPLPDVAPSVDATTGNEAADEGMTATPVPGPAPLADAFAALLAAEQGEPDAPPVAAPFAPSRDLEADEDTFDRIAERVLSKLGDRLPISAATLPAEPLISDEFVDRVARRVIEKMGDLAVRETVSDVVLTVADRLVREEIERIKSQTS